MKSTPEDLKWARVAPMRVVVRAEGEAGRRG